MTLQGVYEKWLGTLPPTLGERQVDALRAMGELNLSELESVDPPRGFRVD